MYKQYKGRKVERSLDTAIRRIAGERYSKIVGEIVGGSYFDNQLRQTTFAELWTRYEAKHCKSRDMDSIKRLLPVFGGYQLSAITTNMISDYRSERAIKVKPATIYLELALMRRMFNVARREFKLVKDNPVADLSFSVGNKNARDRWLTVEDEQRLLEAATNPVWLRMLLLTALHTGMRRGEMLALKWQDVDMFRRLITIHRSKNGDKRAIPLSQTLYSVFKQAKIRDISGLVFPIAIRSLRAAFDKALAKANIADFHFHDLRHTFATRLVQNGVDLFKVKEILGHKTIIMTMRYSHHCCDSLRSSIDVLDKNPYNSPTISKDVVNQT